MNYSVRKAFWAEQVEYATVEMPNAVYRFDNGSLSKSLRVL